MFRTAYNVGALIAAGIILSPLIIFAAAARLLDLFELRVLYAGDEAAREKARWRQF